MPIPVDDGDWALGPAPAVEERLHDAVDRDLIPFLEIEEINTSDCSERDASAPDSDEAAPASDYLPSEHGNRTEDDEDDDVRWTREVVALVPGTRAPAQVGDWTVGGPTVADYTDDYTVESPRTVHALRPVQYPS